MYKITTAERMLQNLVVEYEKVADPRLPACSRASGHLLETCCTIMDMKGVGISSAPSVYGYLKSASAISQNYYPERLGRLYIINAPWGFSSIFGVVKGFLDPVTVAKIHVLGAGYQKDLLAQVPKENLPKAFGGACECDGGCMLGDQGPWQDPKWTKEPAWAKEAGAEEKEAGVEAVDAPRPASQGTPAAAGAGAAAETATPSAVAPGAGPEHKETPVAPVEAGEEQEAVRQPSKLPVEHVEPPAPVKST